MADLLRPLVRLADGGSLARWIGDALVRTVATGCQIDLFEGGVLRNVVRQVGAEGEVPAAPDPGLLAEVARARAPRLEPAGAGLSWVVLPLVHAERTIGTFAVALDPTNWASTDELLVELTSLAGSLAVVLSDVRAHEQASRVSQTLQESLLPSALPDEDWFEIAGTYVPGTAGLEVGGDWYDAQILDDGTLALSVGDVAGHGIEAAASMGELRSATAALRLVRRTPGDLISVLHRLADTMGYFATATCVRLDPSGRLVWASAGHLPSLLVRAAGDVEVLVSEQSPPLGTGFRGAVATNSHHLERGDLVLLYTDGLIERRGEPVDAGIARLAERVRSLALSTPKELVHGLVDQLHGRRSTRDDIAVLAARWR